MKIVFTGVLDSVRDRETQKFEDMGIIVQKGITKATDVLIKGYNPGQTKLDKAEKYGIKVMRESAFFEMLKLDFPEYYL